MDRLYAGLWESGCDIPVIAGESRPRFEAADQWTTAVTGPAQREIEKEWKRFAPKDRIAMIGAGEDDPWISAYADEQRKRGKTVFFYADCVVVSGTLCPHETIGAFMKTAGTVLNMDSPAARKSPYVRREAAMVQRLRAGQRGITMISPADIQAGAEGALYVTSARIMVVNVDNTDQ